MITVEAKLTNKEMFNFLMRHNYFSMGGVCGVILSIGALVILFINIKNDEMSNAYKFALIFIGLLFTVIQPVMLYVKATTQVKKSDSVNKALKYEFDEKGFTISLGEEKVAEDYGAVTKIISTKLSVIIYISKYRAFIIPKRDLIENFEAFKELLNKNVKNAKSVSVK